LIHFYKRADMFSGVLRVGNSRIVGWCRRGIRGGTQGRGERTRNRLMCLERENITGLVPSHVIDKLEVERELVRSINNKFTNELVEKKSAALNEPPTDIRKTKSYRNYKLQIKKLKTEVSCQTVTLDNQFEMVSNAVTMLHNIAYVEQLNMKTNKNKEMIERLKGHKKASKQVTCSTSRTIPSPVIESYRTKDQFSVMTDIQGKVTVGFFVGSKREGVVCVEPSPIKIIRDSHKNVARVYQEMLRKSALPIHIYQSDESNDVRGYWGGIMVRSNFKGEIMVKIEFVKNDLSEERLEEVMGEIKEAFTDSGLPIVSLYLALQKKKNDVKNSLILGKKTLIEMIGGVPMHLGPDTFCQGNIGGTEILLDLVARKINSSKNKTMLDLCCGAGLYSLHLADKFRGCIGVDISNMNIANVNAEINGLDNCSFIRGSVRSKLPNIVDDLKNLGAGVSAVLNPGRAGVHSTVIKELRGLPLLDTVVYISCQPEDQQVYYNMTGLMMEEGNKSSRNTISKPFSLVESIPVDLFPQTHHCEHVCVFRR